MGTVIQFADYKARMNGQREQPREPTEQDRKEDEWFAKTWPTLPLEKQLLILHKAGLLGRYARA